MSYRVALFAGAFALALGTHAAFPTMAQETEAPAAEQPAAEAPSYPEEKLKSFAVAYLEVAKIGQSYQAQLQGAENAEDQQRIQREAGGKMKEAVEQSDGISVEEYNQIINTAQTDEELANTLSGHIREAAGQQQ